MSASRKQETRICLENMQILLLIVFLSCLEWGQSSDLYPKMYTPVHILEDIKYSCLTVFYEGSIANYQTIMHQLLNVYINDGNVQIGTANFDNFYWPNGEKIRIKGSKDKYSPQENDILLFYKERVDRTCLVKSKITWNPMPELHNYKGVDTLSVLIELINEKCNSFRNVKGNLNTKGMHREDILKSPFHVNSISDVSMGYLYERSLNHPFLNQNNRNVLPPEVFISANYCGFCSSEDKSKNTKFCNSVCVQNKYSKESNTVNPQIAQCDKIKLPSTKEEFMNLYLETSKPVIIEDGVKDWPAFKKWSNKFLLDKYGDKDVHVKLTPGGDFEGVERAELWENYDTFNIPKKVKSQLLYPDLVVVRPAGISMNFSQFIDLITQAADQKKRNISAYLEYSSIPNYMPELEEDLQEFAFAKDLKRKHLNMWLSDGHTLGRLHFDPFDNFLCQMRGKKQVLMFEPHNNTMLYEGHIPQATLSYDMKLQKFRRQKLEDSTSMVMSPVDILKPDFHRFPTFADAMPLNCTINEGDVLYMPAFWWHEVYSWPNKLEKRNLAVNFWYEPFLQKEFPCPECQMDINPYYHDLL